jgi:hypothetical protein
LLATHPFREKLHSATHRKGVSLHFIQILACRGAALFFERKRLLSPHYHFIVPSAFFFAKRFSFYRLFLSKKIARLM